MTNTDPMYKVHTFSIVTDGKVKKIEASAMGPVGTGTTTVDPKPVEPLLTVAEQKAKRSPADGKTRTKE